MFLVCCTLFINNNIITQLTLLSFYSSGCPWKWWLARSCWSTCEYHSSHFASTSSSWFFFYNVIAFDNTATNWLDMNPNLQIFVLSTGACWACWSSRFPRISRSQGLYRSHYNKPVLFKFFIRSFKTVNRSLFSLVRWNKNQCIPICLVLVVIFYKLLYNLVKKEKDALIVMSLSWLKNVDELICNSRPMIFLKYIWEHVRIERTSAVLHGGTNVGFTGKWNVEEITFIHLLMIYCVLSGRSWSYWSPWNWRTTGTPRRGRYPRISWTRRSIGSFVFTHTDHPDFDLLTQQSYAVFVVDTMWCIASSSLSVQGNPGTDGIPGAKGSAVSPLSVFMVLESSITLCFFIIHNIHF